MVIDFCNLIRKKNQLPMSPKVRQAAQYIVNNLASPLSVESVAKRYTSPPITCRPALKRDTGISVPQFIRHHRLNVAVDLLTNTNMSIRDISTTVGFSTLSYFTKLFREEKGMPPLNTASSPVAPFPILLRQRRKTMRKILELKDGWEIAQHCGGAFSPVSIPHTWNALDGQDGGGDYDRSEHVYRLHFARPEAEQVFIRFEGVNHTAAVHCNGRYVGTHRGGYLPLRWSSRKPCATVSTGWPSM